MSLIAVFIALIFFFSLVSGRIERTILTAPIPFTVAGVLASFLLPELREGRGNLALLLHVAEIGLVLLLFSDASRIDLRILRSFRSLPVRLLSTGMLLTIVLGALGAEEPDAQPDERAVAPSPSGRARHARCSTTAAADVPRWSASSLQRWRLRSFSFSRRGSRRFPRWQSQPFSDSPG